MKLNESKILILLSSIILGFVLASQLSFAKFIPREAVTLQSYQQMTSEIKALTDQIGILEDKRSKLKLDVWKYEHSASFSSEIDKLAEELNKYDMYIGLIDVEGPGLVVSLDDAEGESALENRDILGDYGIVHDSDILKLVGELKSAGAEAISVNDQRIIHSSDIYCGGPIIYVNGLELVPPYIIKAIGDFESLSYILTKEGSYYRSLEERELRVNFRRENLIKIFGYDRKLDYKYMKPVGE